MNQRGEYGGAPRGSFFAAVGAAPLQPGDAQRAVEQLDAEMEAIIAATYQAMGVDPATIRRPAVADAAWMQRVRDARAKAAQSPLLPFWDSTVSPKYDDWKAQREVFRAKPMASWDDYALWLARIRQLRADVKAKGIKLDIPELVDLSKGTEAAPAVDSDRSKLLTWGAIGAASVAGVVALIALASSTKKAREPYERYRYGY